MKNSKTFLLVFSALAFTCSCWAADTSKRDKDIFANASSSSANFNDLKPVVTQIQNDINSAHKQVNLDQLFKSEEKFKSLLQYTSSAQWEAMANDLGAHRWGEQSWRDAVGGFLFYPKNATDLFDCPHTDHLLKRIDMIWAFALSAKYGHPLGMYYLADALRKASFDDLDEVENKEKRHFINVLYKKSLDNLEKDTSSNPDACYTLGFNYAGYDLKVGARSLDLSKALEWFQKPIGDNRNQLAVLVLKDSYLGFFKKKERPTTLKDYKKIGKTKKEKKIYGPAYIKAADKIDDVGEKILHLEKAKENYKNTYVYLGDFYNDLEEYGKAIESYEEAGDEHGITKGYIKYSEMLVGDLSNVVLENKRTREIIKHAKNERISKAEALLKKAGESRDPEGYDHLARLYEELLNIRTEIKDQSTYRELLEFAIKKGMELGSSNAYYRAREFFSADYYSKLVSAYGKDPGSDLWQEIKSSLENPNYKYPNSHY